jgi:peptide/nickel transport system permease protein
MLGFILRRLFATIPVLGMVALFVFFMLRMTPGDPAAVLAGDNGTPQQIEEIREQLGLNKPILTQLAIWGGKLLQGDLGESFYFKKPITQLILFRVEPTLSLAVVTLIITILIAVPLGVLAAYRHGSWIDRFVMGFSVMGFSVPVFVMGYLLIYIFAIELKLFPVQGYRSISDGFWPYLHRLLLPGVTLSMIYIALIARITRASMLEVLDEEYIRTARSKGVK